MDVLIAIEDQRKAETTETNLSTEKAGSLHVADAIRNSFALLSRANGTLPIIAWYVFQWRVETVKVVDGRARLAAEQIAHFMTYSTVIVVLDVSCRK